MTFKKIIVGLCTESRQIECYNAGDTTMKCMLIILKNEMPEHDNISD